MPGQVAHATPDKRLRRTGIFINREIKRRTKAIGAVPDGQSALMLVCARLRHVAASEWGSKRYLNMNHLFDLELQRKVEDQAVVS